MDKTRASLPMLLTVDDAAGLLRTTRRAVYAMVERRQLPGVVRLRRRVLLRSDDLLAWLDQQRAPQACVTLRVPEVTCRRPEE